MAEMVVSMADLRRSCDAVLAHLEEIGYDVVRIPHDYYWEVLSSDAYDMDSKPAELAVGSLEDDAKQMRRAAEDASMALVTDLVPLAAMLRAIGSVALESGPTDE